MSNLGESLVSIILPVLNREKYIRQCLGAVLAQSEQNFELVIIDDGSTDSTLSEVSNFEFLISKQYPDLQLQVIKNKERLAPWGNFERACRASQAKYCVLLSVDVVIDKDFIKNAVEIMEQDDNIGCLQTKILQYTLSELSANGYPLTAKLIDTVGFGIFKSRRVVNLGHGQVDSGQFNEQKEIFAVEGAVPFYRREAFLDCAISSTTNYKPQTINSSEIVDHDMFWYGDDIDLGWRMNLFGWKQIFTPTVIAYHDRSTTKGMSYHWWDYLARIKARRQIRIDKRRLDWRNKRLARIKNEQWPNVWRHLPQILLRELSELIYIILIEPSVLLEMFNLFKLWPKMLNKRRMIMRRTKRSAEEMRRWFV